MTKAETKAKLVRLIGVAQGTAENLDSLLDQVQEFKSTLSPEMRKQVEQFEKENANIQKAAKQMEDLKGFKFGDKI